jgi:hypothetical protein
VTGVSLQLNKQQPKKKGRWVHAGDLTTHQRRLALVPALPTNRCLALFSPPAFGAMPASETPNNLLPFPSRVHSKRAQQRICNARSHQQVSYGKR